MSNAPSAIGAANPVDVGVLRCLRCDYDLRGAPPGGACPECATPIAATLDARTHGYGPHTAAQARGAGLIALAWWATPLLAVIVAAMTLDHPQVEWLYTQLGLGVVPPLLWIVGVWCFTKRPPPGMNRAPLLRCATRWGVVVLLPVLWLFLAADTLVDTYYIALGRPTYPVPLIDSALALQRRYAAPCEAATWLCLTAPALLLWYTARLPFLSWGYRRLTRTLALMNVFAVAYFAARNYLAGPQLHGLPDLIGYTFWERLLFGLVAADLMLLIGVGGVCWFRLWRYMRQLARRLPA